MKLTINLNDPNERANAIAVIGLWDEEAAQPTEETTYLPEDTPVVEPDIIVPDPEAEPEPAVEEPVVEHPKAEVPTAKKPAKVPELVEVQNLAQQRIKVDQTLSKTDAIAMLSELGVSRIQDLDEAGLVTFYGKLQALEAEANV